MKRKSCPVMVKAAAGDGADSGEFEAIVSVFGNVDSWGDVVMPGAFKDTLAAWKARGDSIPVLWSHRMDDPRFNIGSVVEASELAPGDSRIPSWADDAVKANGGLYVKGRIDTGDGASDVAQAARQLLMNRRVTQFSFAYDVVESGTVKVDGRDANALQKLTLYEISPTQIGANDRTELIGAKAAATVDDPAALAALVGQADQAIDDALAAVTAADETFDALMDMLALPDTDVDEPAEDAAKNARRLLLKVGRTLSTKNETNIRKAVELLTETLSALDAPPADDGKAGQPAAKAAAELRNLQIAELEFAALI